MLADTARGPGLGAGLVRVHGTGKAVAFTSDVTPRYVEGEPVRGRQAGGGRGLAQPRGRWARGRSPRPTTSTSATPRSPRSWASSCGAIQGIGEACRALDFPIVSGNVSLYNETDGRGDPAHADHRRRGPAALARRADRGRCARAATPRCWSARPGAHLGQSALLAEAFGLEEGPPPPVDLQAERRNGRVRAGPAPLVRAATDLVRRRPGARRLRDGRGGGDRRRARPGRHRRALRRGPGALPRRHRATPTRSSPPGGWRRFRPRWWAGSAATRCASAPPRRRSATSSRSTRGPSPPRWADTACARSVRGPRPTAASRGSRRTLSAPPKRRPRLPDRRRRGQWRASATGRRAAACPIGETSVLELRPTLALGRRLACGATARLRGRADWRPGRERVRRRASSGGPKYSAGGG